MADTKDAENQHSKTSVSRKRNVRVVSHSEESQIKTALVWAKANPIKTALLLAGGAYLLSHKLSRKAIFWGGSAILSSVVSPKEIMETITHFEPSESTTVH